MSSIKEILEKTPDYISKDIQEIKDFIENRFNPEDLRKILIDTRNWSEETKFWDYFEILMYKFIQKKIKKQPYSLHSFNEGLKVLITTDRYVDFVWKNLHSWSEKHSISTTNIKILEIKTLYEWIQGWITEAMQDQHKEYEEIPAQHGVAFALCRKLQRDKNFENSDWTEYINKTKEWWIEDFKENSQFIKEDFQNHIGKKYDFNKIFPVNKADIGYVFLLLEKWNDKEAIIFEPIKNDSPEIVNLLFNMFFCAYLHNKSFLTTIKVKKKIEKFGFFYSDLYFYNAENIFKFQSDELTRLFVKLHKKMNAEVVPINCQQRVCFWLKKNLLKATSIVAVVIGLMNYFK